MFISTLRLNNFRNIENCALEFSQGVNVIYGKNAQGKTNILESVFLCSTGRSHRTRLEKELIRFGESHSNAGVLYNKRGVENSIEVYLKNNEKKGIAVNGGAIRRIGELFGRMQTVIFSPEDLYIINGSPSERRRFMDIQICQLDELYYYHLHTYHKVLKQRNSLLKQKWDKSLKETVFAWDSQLVSHGIEIINIRNNFIGALFPIAQRIHSALTGGNETLVVEYRPCVLGKDFEKRLAKNIDKDISHGQTSIGPHKDDIVFYINGRDAKVYGSQGQKRTVMLACRLAEVELVSEEIGDPPVLLLDDALSELDGQRQELLAEYAGGIQTIITATGMEDLIGQMKSGAKVFYIDSGIIINREDTYE